MDTSSKHPAAPIKLLLGLAILVALAPASMSQERSSARLGGPTQLPAASPVATQPSATPEPPAFLPSPGQAPSEKAVPQQNEPPAKPPASQPTQPQPMPKAAVPSPAQMPAEKGPVPQRNFDLPPPRTENGQLILPSPALEPGEESLPINLPAALQLADARSLDINIAVQQLRVAAAAVLSADVLWLPTVAIGGDYQHHDGPTQNADGSITSASHSSLYAGLSPVAYFALSDAIFAPLAARQLERAQAANVQTATNDSLTNVAISYFDAQEAREDLAGAEEVVRRASALVRKTEGLVPGLVPEVELARVRAAYANAQQIVETARQRWRVSSAEVARVLRLKPSVIVEPVEPPQLKLTLVASTRIPDELIPVALATRPELTFTQAQAEAARYNLQEERFRPLMPTLLVRGGGTTPPYPMAYGAFGAGPGDSLNHFTGRGDYDVECLWELRNLGFGNLSLIRSKQAAYDLARAQDYRFRDFVAKEVMEALAELRSAERRSMEAEDEVRQAEISATKNLQGLGEVKQVAQSKVYILIIRPLEVVASLQALSTAYYDYFGAHADYNRAQFRLYRALGNPSQFLIGRNGLLGAPLPETPPPCSPYGCPGPCDQPRPEPPCPLKPGCLPPAPGALCDR